MDVKLLYRGPSTRYRVPGGFAWRDGDPVVVTDDVAQRALAERAQLFDIVEVIPDPEPKPKPRTRKRAARNPEPDTVPEAAAEQPAEEVKE